METSDHEHDNTQKLLPGAHAGFDQPPTNACEYFDGLWPDVAFSFDGRQELCRFCGQSGQISFRTKMQKRRLLLYAWRRFTR